MIIIISSKIGERDIKESLGKPEYSYYFLMKEFIPALNTIGTVIEAESAAMVDQLYQTYCAKGETVVFLSFTPPHQTPLRSNCPTFCVFAWEFDCIPGQEWGNDSPQNWCYVFSHLRGAITLSEESAQAVRQAMGQEFPVITIPAPLWDQYADLCPEKGLAPQLGLRQLAFHGEVIDSPLLGLSADGLAKHPTPQPATSTPKSVLTERPQKPLTDKNRRWITSCMLAKGWWRETFAPFLRKKVVASDTSPRPPIPENVENTNLLIRDQLLKLSGVVYTSVLNPEDGRKNWIDLISAFCWAFKNEGNATLVIKMVHSDTESYKTKVMTHLSRLSPFKCRVVVINGYLETDVYRKLIEASTYYVNSSACEGFCLPLVEYLCSGKPAISPRHTAMHDYINSDVAVPVKSSKEPASFLHDPANRLCTRRYRLNWESFVAAYLTSYQLATDNPEQYRKMSRTAHQTFMKYCSIEQVSKTLALFLTEGLKFNDGNKNRIFQQ